MRNSKTAQIEFSLLLRGLPKSGKTSLALMFPRPALLSADHNVFGPAQVLKTYQAGKEFDFTFLDQKDDGTTVKEELRWTHFVTKLKEVAQSPDYDTIVIDNITEIAQYLQWHILNTKSDSKEKDRMTIADWVPFHDLMTRTVFATRRLGKIVIWIAHEQLAEDARGKLVYHVAIPSRLSTSLGGLFSDVWRTEVRETSGKPTYYVRTVSQNDTPGLGSALRVMGLPDTFEFSWEKFNKLLGWSPEQPKATA